MTFLAIAVLVLIVAVATVSAAEGKTFSSSRAKPSAGYIVLALMNEAAVVALALAVLLGH